MFQHNRKSPLAASDSAEVALQAVEKFSPATTVLFVVELVTHENRVISIR